MAASTTDKKEEAAKAAASSEAQATETNQTPKGQNVGTLPEDQRPPGDLRRRTAPDKRQGPFVKYVGNAALRRITVPQWKSLAGVNSENKDLTENVWSIDNDKMIEASKFADDQLDYLLIDDLQQGTNAHSFLYVDYNSDNELVQVPYN